MTIEQKLAPVKCTCLSNSSPQWHSRDCPVRKQFEASGAKRLTWAEEKALLENGPPPCAVCGTPMIQVRHDTWEPNCEHE